MFWRVRFLITRVRCVWYPWFVFLENNWTMWSNLLTWQLLTSGNHLGKSSITLIGGTSRWCRHLRNLSLIEHFHALLAFVSYRTLLMITFRPWSSCLEVETVSLHEKYTSFFHRENLQTVWTLYRAPNHNISKQSKKSQNCPQAEQSMITADSAGVSSRLQYDLGFTC